MIWVLFLITTLLTPLTQAETLRDLSSVALPTYIECDLQVERANCEPLMRGFFADYGAYFVRAQKTEDAKIRVRITDQAIAGGPTEFTFSWTADPALNVSDFSYVTTIDRSVLDDLAFINELLKSIAKGGSLYLKVISGEVDESGQLVITSVLPNAVKPPSNSPFYANFSFDGSSFRNGQNKNQSASGGINLNYSTDRVRLIVGGNISQQSASVPSEDGNITARNQGYSGYGVGVYSFKKRWSVALIGEARSNEGQNIRAEKKVATGVEWTLVPYRTTETREVYVRIGGGVIDLDLFAKNDLDYQRHQYGYIFAHMFANWTFMQNKAKFSLGGSVRAFPEVTGYETFTGSSGLFYQISPAIQLRAQYETSYQKKSLTFPKEPDYSNPIQSMYLTGAPGRTTFLSFGVNVTLGNALRQSRDRRWGGN